MEQIAILMAAYQGAAYLKEQLDSILAQDITNWRLIVRDDGSSDETWMILKEYQARCPEKIFIRKNEKNLGGTKNFLTMLQDCAAETTNPEGQYYMFADQDDLWHTNKLRRSLARIKQMEKKYTPAAPALVFSDAAVVDAAGRLIHPSIYGLQHLQVRKRSFSHLLMENLCQGCTMMMNAALAQLVMTIPENARYHDWWIALLAAAFGHISYVAEPLLDYRQHENNVVGSVGFADYVRKRLKGLGEQRLALQANYRQAAEFQKLYGGLLKLEDYRQLEQFAGLPQKRFLERRLTVLKYGFLKSGLLRNLGLLLIL